MFRRRQLSTIISSFRKSHLLSVESVDSNKDAVYCSLKSIEMNSVLKACLAESASLPKKSGNRRADRQAPQRIQEAATALQQSMEEWTYNGGERLAQAKSGEYKALLPPSAFLSVAVFQLSLVCCLHFNLFTILELFYKCK